MLGGGKWLSLTSFQKICDYWNFGVDVMVNEFTIFHLDSHANPKAEKWVHQLQKIIKNEVGLKNWK